MRINVDLTGIEGLDRAAAGFTEGVSRGVYRAARHVWQIKQRQVGRTYSRAIPMSRRGRPKWVRSGNWLRGQMLTQHSPTEWHVVTQGAAAEPITNYPGGYEEKLSVLPRSRDGVNRRNAAAKDTARITKPQLAPMVEQEIRNALGL